MHFIDKIKTSWWVILSVIPFLNGLGFIYIGFRHNNRNWILEGISYEFPWFFYFIIFANYGQGLASGAIIAIALLLMLISIIRSIWVAIKLVDVYENNEKYTIKQTNLNQQHRKQENDNDSGFGCCLCLACIFFLFAIIIIL